MRTNATRALAPSTSARVAGERAASWRSDNDSSNINIDNNSSSNNNIDDGDHCRHCPAYLDYSGGQSTTPTAKTEPTAAETSVVGQQWTTKASLGAKRNCKLGEPSELASSKKMAPPSPLSWLPAPLSSTTTEAARSTNLGNHSTRSDSSSCSSLGNSSNCGRISRSSREAPVPAPSADQQKGREEKEEEGGNQIDRTMLVKKSVPPTLKTWGTELKRAGQSCRRRNECDRGRRAMALASVALNCLEKSNGHHDDGGDPRGLDCSTSNDCLREIEEAPIREVDEPSFEGDRRKHESRVLAEEAGISNDHHHHQRTTTTMTAIVIRALQAGQRKWPEAQPEIQKRHKLLERRQSRQRDRTNSSSHDNQRCSVVIKLAELVFIYIIITSSVAVVLSPVSATHYWPLRSRTLSQHHHHHQQQPQPQPQHLLAPPTALAAPAVTALESSESEEISLSPLKSSRGQLMIGQHYNNFSSIIPYSVLQDSDADYSAGQAQEDQLLDELPESQQQHHLGATASAVASNSNGDEESLLKSRALLPLDSSRLGLPQMQQIKSRFNQGCVGGTKCQFFAFCWMSGGSLGASCGLLMTCCVTPSRQEIQPGFYGPVVNDPYCGRSTSKINRIVGGTDASFGQFPWQAFVQVGGSRCGGALISSRHVVTAGHCVARSQHSPSSIKVTLGDYILNSDIESIPHEVFSVVEVLLHPNFRFTPQADRYDVAVLELERAASYKDNIKPICLPQKDAAFVGRVAYVAGWGALQAGSKLRPKVLQHVAVPVIENQVCESWHRRKGIDIRIYDEMMCAGYELGQRDACQGDSGGPLMLNQFGVWYLVGIVSAGYSCAKQHQPGIYHRVSSSSDWISSNIYQQQGANK